MNLIAEMQQEMNRCRELLAEYEKIGPSGAFGAAVIKNSIKSGEAAIASGDIDRMLAAYEDLKKRE